ncbi:glycosyl hydrolase family 3 N terminal domain-containing protein [Xylaria palmicola]|nr:glycosyl hydrolase family 3 N terminal domain-containing protein [Xylaria palmicola]
MYKHLFAIALALIVAADGASSEDSPATLPIFYPSPWGSGGPDGWDEAYERAHEFVSKLTVTEKVNLTTGTGNQANLCTGNTGSIPRLGFRELCLQDGPVGVRYTDLNSAFPAGINAAATWSRSLIRRRGEALGAEFRDKGIDVLLGPVVGPLGRDPAGGRNFEGFGPDPYLAGVAVAQTVEGTQSAGVIASVKHYILNEQEHYRGSISSNIDDKTMHELYLWPFADAVRAGVGSVMCSYNKINNTYACENTYVINQLLKNELGFQGFVVSDWGGQHSGGLSALAGLDMTMPGDARNTTYGSYWGAGLTEAILALGVTQFRFDDMVVRIMAAFYKVGRDKKQVDINYSSWTNETVGPRYWHSKTGNTTVNKHVDVRGDHAEIIREMGAKSVVLLKNERNALPLKKPASIAIIGEDAQDNPNGPNACVDRICNVGTLAMGWGSATAEFPYLISPATALEKQASADGTIFINVKSNWDLGAARAAAANASAAIVFVNANSGEGYQTLDGNFGDRKNLTLWNGGDALIAAVASANPNTVVVIHSVGPVLVDHFRTHPNVTALLWAGLPGQESGNSLADVLYGRVNPQGRTPFTWGKAAGDWGVATLVDAGTPSAPQQDFSEGSFIDYRHFDRAGIEPSFAFGFGLSYTNFAYANLAVERQDVGPYVPASGETVAGPTFGGINYDPISALEPEGFQKVPGMVYPWINNTDLPDYTGSPDYPYAGHNRSAQPILPAGGGPGGNPELYKVVYVVSVDVTNTGKVDGTDIPQLYLSLGGPDEPKVVLRGFDEVELKAGETKTVAFNLTYRDLSNWDVEAQDWKVTSHLKTVYVGASSRDLRLHAELEL